MYSGLWCPLSVPLECKLDEKAILYKASKFATIGESLNFCTPYFGASILTLRKVRTVFIPQFAIYVI